MTEIGKSQLNPRKPLKEYYKWLMIGVAILNPIANSQAAQNYITRMSSPPPHPPLPFLGAHIGAIFWLTIVLGLITLPRWQGFLAWIIALTSMFLWSYAA